MTKKIYGLMLHGLTSSGDKWMPIVDALQQDHFQQLECEMPNAPELPLTLMGGKRVPAWFDFQGLGPDAPRQDVEGIVASTKIIHGYLDDMIANKAGGDSKSVFLFGFSQGGMMALFAGLRYDKPLGGIIALSTYLPLLKQIQRREIELLQPRDTRILYCHGDKDSLLDLEWAKQCTKVIKSFGYSNVETHWMHKLEHTTNAETLAILRNFFDQQ